MLAIVRRSAIHAHAHSMPTAVAIIGAYIIDSYVSCDLK
jgi:hypothetical protein